MGTVVSQIVTREVDDPLVGLFFDGTLPAGSINFLTNQSAFERLEFNLITFFGAALGCNDPNFPKYRGKTDMKVVHAKMPIDQATFASFITIFVTTLRSLGVTEDDLYTVDSLLNSFALQIVDPKTICPKYAGALGISELTLMTTVINAVFKKELADPQVLPFFNGQVPAFSINFLTNQTQFKRLANNLVTFFGAALGCTKNFPPYTGKPSMRVVHQNMPITAEIFYHFNNNLVNVLGELGVSAADQLTVSRILMTFSSQIVSR